MHDDDEIPGTMALIATTPDLIDPVFNEDDVVREALAGTNEEDEHGE